MKKFLSTYIKFSEDEYELFISKAKLRKYKKGEHLLVADRPVEKLFFVKSGFIRGYRIIEGVDTTHHFFLEDWFATDYESYLTGKSGELFAQALVETTVYEFNKSTLHSFFQTNQKFEKIRFVQAEDAYLQMVNRLKNFQSMDLKERYMSLISRNPKLFNRVSQKHIASYLGVAPQSLSRIKSTLKGV